MMFHKITTLTSFGIFFLAGIYRLPRLLVRFQLPFCAARRSLADLATPVQMVDQGLCCHGVGSAELGFLQYGRACLESFNVHAQRVEPRSAQDVLPQGHARLSWPPG